jgi:hypothetical protein
LYFAGPDAGATLLGFERFTAHRHLLDEEFGSGIRYDALPGRKARRIHIDRLSGDVLDTDAHEEFITWFISTMETFRPLTQQIKSLLERS